MHLPHPPSPSNGMGVECWTRLDFNESTLEKKFLMRWKKPRMPTLPFSAPTAALGERNFAANEILTARKNATAAVLQTSDSSTASKDGQSVDDRAEQQLSIGARMGRSRRTAKLDCD